MKNTLHYTQLVKSEEDGYVSKVATAVKEFCELIEASFEYICEVYSIRIFRNRK